MLSVASPLPHVKSECAGRVDSGSRSCTSFVTTRGAKAITAATNHLSVEDVLRIHDALCADFAGTGDPIFPPGVKSMALLESAVGRQHTGFAGFRRYAEPVPNAATLTFGLCNDHPFHNGNKRTALVSMLAHLDRNRLTLINTKQEELFEMIIALADNGMAEMVVKRRPRKGLLHLRSGVDAEVEALTGWLVPRLYKVRRGERPITYRDLRSILRVHGFELRDKGSNQIDVCRVIVRRRNLFSSNTVTEYKRIGSIGYRNEGETVSMKTVKDVRRMTGLREEDGCDSESFYAGAEHFDVFINQYRTILRRLARR
jgi:prophage maintenance system killer protein